MKRLILLVGLTLLAAIFVSASSASSRTASGLPVTYCEGVLGGKTVTITNNEWRAIEYNYFTTQGGGYWVDQTEDIAEGEPAAPDETLRNTDEQPALYGPGEGPNWYHVSLVKGACPSPASPADASFVCPHQGDTPMWLNEDTSGMSGGTGGNTSAQQALNQGYFTPFWLPGNVVGGTNLKSGHLDCGAHQWDGTVHGGAGETLNSPTAFLAPPGSKSLTIAGRYPGSQA